MTSADDLEGRYGLLLARENTLDNLGDRDAQEADLDAMKGIADSLENVEKKTEVALQYANYFYAVSNYPSAGDAARKAIELSQDLDEKEMECLANNYLGKSLMKQDIYEEAKEILGKGLILANRSGRKDLFADTLVSLGIIDIYKGTFDQAQSSLEQALKVFQENGNLSGEGRTYTWLGNLFFQQGNHHKANGYQEKSLKIARKIGDRLSESGSLTNLGIVKSSQGDFSSAKELYEHALYITREIGSQGNEAGLLSNLGFNAKQLGLYHEAEHYLKESLAIYSQIGIRVGECVALINLGSVSHDKGEHINAQNYYTKALDLACEIGSIDYEGYALAGLGNVFIGLGQLDIAEETLQKSISLRKEIGQIFLVMESRESLARIAIRHSDISSAQIQINSILGFLDEGNTLDGTEAPFRIYLTCVQVLNANQDPRASKILTDAYNLLQTCAGKISNENLRYSFLNNVVANRDIMREYESENIVEE